MDRGEAGAAIGRAVQQARITALAELPAELAAELPALGSAP